MSRVSFHICNSVIDKGVHCGSVVLIIIIFRSLSLLVHKYITHSPSKYSPDFWPNISQEVSSSKKNNCQVSVAGISQEPAKTTCDSKKRSNGMPPGTDSVCASQERRALPQICPFPIQGSFCFSKNEEYTHTHTHTYIYIHTYIQLFISKLH